MGSGAEPPDDVDLMLAIFDATERRMDPRVVATNRDTGEVVVLWRQRGRRPAGERFDSPVLGLYQLRDGRLARAQMFYFDTAAVAGFLAS